ncbi:hypothetical protein BX616_008311, partial [Lobosporangium transversale]
CAWMKCLTACLVRRAWVIRCAPDVDPSDWETVVEWLEAPQIEQGRLTRGGRMEDEGADGERVIGE